MGAAEEKFARNVLACVDDINAALPSLAQRYSDLAMATALAQHVGGALRLFLRHGVCGPAQARRVVDRMREAAFPDANAW